MNLILFDGEERDHLLPLTFTRPVSEIRVGILSLREKWEKALNKTSSWHTQPYLSRLFPMHRGKDNMLVHGGLLPDPELVKTIGTLKPGESLAGKGVILAARIPGDRMDQFIDQGWDVCRQREYGPDYQMISRLWDIFQLNGEQIREDARYFRKVAEPGELGQGNILIRPENIIAEEGAKADACVINATGGPVYLGRKSLIMEGACIRGPFAMGEGSVVKMGARIYENTSMGAQCKVGGEVNNAVFFSYSNKQHDGYLGNAVIGEWCNLGAGSCNSNLKNNYARIKLWDYPAGGFVDTGLQFCGLIMGDHSKCGIQTMFNTGTVVGVSSNIYGSGFPRNFIPSFSWGGAHGFTEYTVEKAFVVAELVMRRRGKEFGQADREMLQEVYRLTKRYRTY